MYKVKNLDKITGIVVYDSDGTPITIPPQGEAITKKRIEIEGISCEKIAEEPKKPKKKQEDD